MDDIDMDEPAMSDASVGESKHPSGEEFRWYTRFGLRLALQEWPSPRLEAFEGHVLDCDACAQRLAAEAQNELMLEELARRQPADSQKLSAGWALATLAALMLFLVVGVARASSGPVHSQAGAPSPSLDAGLLVSDGDLALKSFEH